MRAVVALYLEQCKEPVCFNKLKQTTFLSLKVLNISNWLEFNCKQFGARNCLGPIDRRSMLRPKMAYIILFYHSKASKLDSASKPKSVCY